MEPNLKSRLIEVAAQRLGYACERVGYFVVLVTVDGTQRSFLQMCGPTASAANKHICDHKDITRRYLDAANLPTTRATTIATEDTAAGLAAAEAIGYPIVVKPSSLSQGRGVTTSIDDPAQLDRALVAVAELGARHAIIESHLDNVTDYRFFMTPDELFVTMRVPAHVTGDGSSTVAELITAKNTARGKNPYCRDYLIPTALDQLPVLQAAGRDLNFVPAAGDVQYLRASANVSSGGDSVDITDDTHPAFKDLARRSLASVPGMQYGGVDILAGDVTVAPSETMHVVSELEFSPAPLSNFPIVGQPRDMAAAILRYYAAV